VRDIALLQQRCLVQFVVIPGLSAPCRTANATGMAGHENPGCQHHVVQRRSCPRHVVRERLWRRYVVL